MTDEESFDAFMREWMGRTDRFLRLRAEAERAWIRETSRLIDERRVGPRPPGPQKLRHEPGKGNP